MKLYISIKIIVQSKYLIYEYKLYIDIFNHIFGFPIETLPKFLQIRTLDFHRI